MNLILKWQSRVTQVGFIILSKKLTSWECLINTCLVACVCHLSTINLSISAFYLHPGACTSVVTLPVCVNSHDSHSVQSFFWILRRVSPGLCLPGAYDQNEVRAHQVFSGMVGDIRHSIHFPGLKTKQKNVLYHNSRAKVWSASVGRPTLSPKAPGESPYLDLEVAGGCMHMPTCDCLYSLPSVSLPHSFSLCVSSFGCPSDQDMWGHSGLTQKTQVKLLLLGTWDFSHLFPYPVIFTGFGD